MELSPINEQMGSSSRKQYRAQAKRSRRQYYILKYCLISFIIATPLGLISGFYLTFLYSFPASSNTSAPSSQLKQNTSTYQNSDMKESKGNTIKYSVILKNEDGLHSLTLDHTYELIQINNNDLEILFVQDNNALKSGFSFTVDIGDQSKDGEYLQEIIFTLSRGGKIFSSMIMENNLNFKYKVDRNIHWFYLDFQYDYLEPAMEGFFEMLYGEDIEDIADREIEKKYQELSLSNKPKMNKEGFVSIINSKGTTKVDEFIAGTIKNAMKTFYRNTNKIKLVVITNNLIEITSSKVGPIWAKLSKTGYKGSSDSRASKEYESNSIGNLNNNLGKVYEYQSEQSIPIGDGIVPRLVNHKKKNEGLLFEYINYLVNDNTISSLTSVLKRGNLVTKLTTRILSTDILNENQFLAITLKLTKEGITSPNKVIQIIQQFFLEGLKHNNYETTYSDLKAIYKHNFDFSTITKYADYLKALNYKLYTSPKLPDLLSSDFTFPEYNQSEIKEILHGLTLIDKYAVFIGHTDNENFHLEINNRNNPGFEYYNLSFYTQPLIYLLSDNLSTPVSFTFKNKNNYGTALKSPSEFSVDYYNSNIRNYQPVKYSLHEVIPSNELWYRYDPLFKSPKIEAFFTFNYTYEDNFRKSSGTEYLRFKFNALEILFYNRIKRLIHAQFIPAIESGNSIHLVFHRGKGFTISIVCYSDLGVGIVKEIFDIIYTENSYFGLNSEDFDKIPYNNINDKLIDYLYNYDTDVIKFKHEAKSLLLKGDGNQLIVPYTLKEEYLNAGSDFFKYFFQPETQIKALLYGVIYPKTGQEEWKINENIGTIIVNHNTKNSPVLVSYTKKIIDGKLNGECMIFIYSYPFYSGEITTNYMLNTLSFGARNAPNEGMTDLFITIYKDLFKSSYNFDSENIVTVIEKIYVDRQIGIKIVKTSKSKYPIVLNEETNLELFTVLDYIREISVDKFDRLKSKLIQLKTLKPVTLEEKAGRAWFEIFDGSDHFDGDSDYAEDLKALRRIEFVNYIKEVMKENMYLSFLFYVHKEGTPGKERKEYNVFRNKICDVKVKGVTEDYNGNIS